LKNKKIKGIMILATIILLNIAVFNIVLQRSLDLVEIPIAKNTIHQRIPLTASDITTKKVPRAYIDEFVIEEIDQIIGKVVSFQTTIYKGMPFYYHALEDGHTTLDAPLLQLKQGQGAVAIAVDLIKSSGNTLLPGQYVDLILTIALKNQPVIVDTMFSSVRVLAVKDRYGLDMSDPKSQKVPHVILLALWQADIRIFYQALQVGKFELVALSMENRIIEEALYNQTCLCREYFNE